MRRDIWLVAGSAVAFAALLAVSWRATPDRRAVVLTLYAIGGLLEVAGVSTIGADLLARRRRLRRYESEAHIQWTGGTWLREPRGPISTSQRIEQRIAAVERELRAAVNATATDARRRDRLLLMLSGATGSDTAAWTGFAALLLGVLVGTAANIVSATA